MTADQALAALAAAALPGRAGADAGRTRFGTPPAAIEALAQGWRRDLGLEARLALAAALWDSEVQEGRIAAARLLAQARIRPSDAEAWQLICTWVPQLDGRSIADPVSIAAGKRLVADPSRLAEVEGWTRAPNVWMRRAALVATLPFARLNHPKPWETAARERVLGWAATLAADRNRMLREAVGLWLASLARHDGPRAAAFLAEHSGEAGEPPRPD